MRDVRGALSWPKKERGFEPGGVVLHGWSMGGATILRSAPGMGVAAVVEESGYADLPLLLRERLPQSSGLPSFFNPGIFLSWPSSAWTSTRGRYGPPRTPRSSRRKASRS